MGHIKRSLRHFLSGILVLGAMCAPAWARFQPPTCKNAFTQQQEITEGQKVAAQVYKQMPVLPDSDPVSKYVRDLGAKLVAHAPGYKWPYNFHVVASEDINAFALPGGSIFVNLGTVQAAETEAQLAGVMAHEISHVVMRHSTCNLTAQQSKSLWYGLGSIASAILLGNGTAGQLSQAAIGSVQSLDFLHMSREDEKQADLLGAGIMYDAGFDPRGLPQFFETIQAKYGSGGAQFLSDHPNPGNRTQYVNAEIATLPRLTHPIVTTPEFKRVHAIAMKEKALPAKEIQSGAWRQSGLYASGPGAGAGQVPLPASQSGGAAQGTAPRLDKKALGIGGRMVRYQGPRFSIDYPQSWQKLGEASDGVTLAPANGATSAGLAYGAIVSVIGVGGNGATDAASLRSATAALMQKLSQQNGGLEQVGQIRTLTINGRPANIVELRGRSPVAQGGRQLAERDRLLTVSRSDGDMSYVVFVCPEPDAELLNSTFNAMASSFRPE
ncbi:MAG TPA: M48 family metallopeptidase [Edaphobacter sp.]|nr:M48 family metallopeptidase [Edaphobacter sp.]